MRRRLLVRYVLIVRMRVGVARMRECLEAALTVAGRWGRGVGAPRSKQRAHISIKQCGDFPKKRQIKETPGGVVC